MTTPPRPTRADYDAAIARIHARRRAAGDDHPLALSDDPREVLTYLRRRGHAGLIKDATGDDLTDALTLRLWLWWEGEAVELWLLQAAEMLGRNRRATGAVLGLATGQGLLDRITRKRTMLGLDHPAPTPPPVPAPDDGRIRQIAAELVARRGEMPAAVIEDDLHADFLADYLPRWPAGSPPPTAAAVQALRFLLGSLDTALPADAPLRALVAAGIDAVGSRTTPSWP